MGILMRPTKEQFQATARFMGIEIMRIVEDSSGKLRCRVRHPDCDFVEEWTPHIPSKDAYLLLMKILASRISDSAIGKKAETIYSKLLAAAEVEDAVDTAEAAFLLAVALWENME